MRKYIFIVFLLLVSTCASCHNLYLWDDAKLSSFKRKFPEWIQKDIIQRGYAYVKEEPLGLTIREKSFAPDKHYFENVGRYWWPDPTDPSKPWIRRDGVVNPESNDYDDVIMNKMVYRVKMISVAYYLTGDIQLYNAIVSQLNTWFLNQDSYMYPNLEYGQVIPGENNNHGRSTGLISMYDLINPLLESIRLVESRKRLPYMTRKGIRNWFKEFQNWIETNPMGIEARDNDTNIALAVDVMLLDIAVFTKSKKTVRQIEETFVDNRILRQILDDGTMPAELSRTKAMAYSIYNLSHIIDYLIISQNLGYNKFNQVDDRVYLAFDYLLKYANNQSAWPHEEISDWNQNIEDLYFQASRLNRIKGYDGRYNEIIEMKPIVTYKDFFRY